MIDYSALAREWAPKIYDVVKGGWPLDFEHQLEQFARSVAEQVASAQVAEVEKRMPVSVASTDGSPQAEAQAHFAFNVYKVAIEDVLAALRASPEQKK